MKSILLPALLVLVLASCTRENVIEPSAETAVQNTADESDDLYGTLNFTEHTVLPKTTDPAITTATFGSPLQYAYLTNNVSKRKNRLFVFIPGTLATSKNYRQILQMAAKCGYYSIGLSYDDIYTIETYSGETTDDKKAENIFEEYLTGNDVSPDVNVPKANGFENRIIKMLLYLDKTYPTENWKRFLTSNNEIKWNLLSVAGHSQGADHAMYMGKERSLFRVGFFSGPYNFKLSNGKYPTWITTQGLTPPERMYGFSHTGDLVRVYSDTQQNWDTLHLVGEPASVDHIKTYSPAYNLYYHQLTTSLGGKFSAFHGKPVADDATPYDAMGLPKYRYVWAYMCFPNN